MGTTRKLEYDAFMSRAGSVRWLNDPYYYETIFAADAAMAEADALLARTEDIESIGYEKQYDKLYSILDAYEKLVTFMETFRSEVYKTDEAFYAEIANGAAEDLSHVSLSDIEIPNTLGLEEYNPHMGQYMPKDHLSIEDFLGNDGNSLEPSVEGFREVFGQTLEMDGESYTIGELIEELEKGARYSNEIHKPGLEALAFVVDCVSFGIKPLFDCACGYDIMSIATAVLAQAGIMRKNYMEPTGDMI